MSKKIKFSIADVPSGDVESEFYAESTKILRNAAKKILAKLVEVPVSPSSRRMIFDYTCNNFRYEMIMEKLRSDGREVEKNAKK